MATWLGKALTMVLAVHTSAFVPMPGFLRAVSSRHECLARGPAQPLVPRSMRLAPPRLQMLAPVQQTSGELDKFSADTHPPYGETGGAMLLMEDVMISRGDRDLMVGVDLRLTAGERVGLVGPNGAGKSTLLSAAAGRLPVTGKVVVRPGLSLGYLVQTAVSGSTRSCWEEASSQMARLNRAQAHLDTITDQIAAGDTSEEVLNAQADALTAFEAAGGYNVDEKIASVLAGLGFGPQDFSKSCTEFSGGWQMKIALARLLLSEPDMLLLDEPTNHLDAKAKAWLGKYLAAYEGTVIIVTHEEALLESAQLTQVVEVRDQQAHMFKGSYSKFLDERVARVDRAMKEFEEQQREIEHLEDYIRRFGAKFSHASQAQDKRKKLERIMAAKVEAPTELETIEDRPRLHFPRPTFCERDMILLRSAAFGWNSQALYSDTDVAIERGMRLVVLGANGCGKSTLLAALSGRLPLLRGERRTADSLDIGLFTQDLAQDLDLEAVALDTVLDTVRRKDATITSERARSVLGSLGLTGSKPLQKIYTMSGGEKARVALATFVLVPHNLLVLDEPSNHLDRATVAVLTEALQEYKGTIIVVTHNRQFCELLAPTHIATVCGAPGTQTVKIEERPLRASDWAGMEADVSSSEDRSRGAATTSRKKGGNGKGSATLKNRSQGSVTVEREAAPEREKYPWELEELVDTGLKQNKQGKLVSKAKKMTPQQKKLEKMQSKSAGASVASAQQWGGGDGGADMPSPGNGGKKGAGKAKRKGKKK